MEKLAVGVSSFRQNISAYMDKCDEHPLVIHKRTKIYVLMKHEHYIDMVNKIKLPNIVQTPTFITTIVQFSHKHH